MKKSPEGGIHGIRKGWQGAEENNYAAERSAKIFQRLNGRMLSMIIISY